MSINGKLKEWKGRKFLNNICIYPHVLGHRHKSVPKRRLFNNKIKTSTNFGFSRGLKFPSSTRQMKSINQESAEDNGSNASAIEEANKTEDETLNHNNEPQSKTNYPTDRNIFDKNNSLGLANLKQSDITVPNINHSSLI
jgi:hypothetical protein